MTGLLADSASWRSTAPSPYAEALAEILVGVFGLYSARTVGLVSSSFTYLNESCCGWPQHYNLFGAHQFSEWFTKSGEVRSELA